MMAAGTLAGCGFTPVLAPGGAGEVLRGRLAIAGPDSRLGFELIGRLEERLGRAQAVTHTLALNLTTTERDLAITGTDDITRVNVDGTLGFRVTDNATGQVVQADEVRTFTAFSITDSPVATAAARRDAEDRLMVALADQLVSRLLSAADTWG